MNTGLIESEFIFIYDSMILWFTFLKDKIFHYFSNNLKQNKAKGYI